MAALLASLVQGCFFERLSKVQSVCRLRFFGTFETEVSTWQRVLSVVSEVTQSLREVQRSWTFLENLFVFSEEVRRELPEVAERFEGINVEAKEVLKRGSEDSIIRSFCCVPGISASLEALQKELSICEKALNDFMESKRKRFPRFYFVSSNDLLDVLSHGNDPAAVMIHIPKVFQAIQTFLLREAEDKTQSARPVATGFTACVGIETLELPTPFQFVGKVRLSPGARPCRLHRRSFYETSLFSF